MNRTLNYYRAVIKLVLIAGVLCVLAIVVAAIPRSEINTVNPSSLITDRNGKFMAELESVEISGYGFWSLETLPPRVVTATLALEDQRFWLHPGVDPIAIGRAVWQNLSSGQRLSGASTLAMQLVRLQHPVKRSYVNKAIEAVAAVIMTLRYGRENVVANYLRWVPYGNRIHGIAYAARRYLDKPVEDLSWAEIAFLAAIPQSPSRMNPFVPSGRHRAVQRGKRLLLILNANEVMSDAELTLALVEIRNIQLPHRQRRPSHAMHAILKIEQQLQQRLQKKQISPLIRSSIDLTLQDSFIQLSQGMLEKWRPKGAGNLSLIVLDKHSNQVLAWIGSDDYFDDTNNGAIDYTQIKRSSGSVLKPFVYALALERGVINATTVIDDLPMLGNPFRNSDHQFLGPMLPRQALSNSRNIPAIRVINKVGLDETYGLLGQLNLHHHELPATHFGQGMALGSLPVRLEDVVRAYSVLASEGLYRDLQWLNNNDNTEDSSQQHVEQVISASTARLITLFLSDPSARLPTFPRMGTTEYVFPVALKTGTSQGYRDAWTVAYSTNYIVGVWVGNAVPRSMDKLNGAGSAAELAQQVLLHLHAKQRHGLADLRFPVPDDYVGVQLCGISGKLAGSACEFSYQEWLPADAVPKEVDSSYVRLFVDTRTGSAAASDTPSQFKRLHTLVNLPARYADWIVKNNMMPLKNGQQENSAPRLSSLPRALHVTIDILSPQNNLTVLRNPEAPGQSSSIALSASVEPPVEQIVWYVDGEPYELVEYPYSTRLPLSPGKHSIQARVPMTPERSEAVFITVE
ncbi:transglycosylase domain-containing protein [Kaarinaea lacus]